MKLTIKKVNDSIQQIESGWELAKGNGYFYWTHPTNSPLDNGSIPVCKLNDLTLEQWIQEFMEFLNSERDSANYQFVGWSVHYNGASAGVCSHRDGPFGFERNKQHFSDFTLIEFMVFVPLLKEGTEDAYLDHSKNIKVEIQRNK